MLVFDIRVKVSSSVLQIYTVARSPHILIVALVYAEDKFPDGVGIFA